MRWWERVGAWDETHRLAVDVVGTALLGLVVVPSSVLLLNAGAPVPALTGWWALAMVVPLAWRRQRPAASAAAVYVVGLLHVLTGQPLLVPADFMVLMALYSVTVHGPVWAYRTAMVGALGGSLLLGGAIALDDQLGGEVQVGLVSAFVAGLMALSVFAFALVRRSRREMIDSLVDRARRLEIERDQQARIATAAERTRIAREMHDIVAHSLSVIIAQADGGRYAAAQDPAAATRSLLTVAETGRAALADMRRLLGVLRPAQDDRGEEDGAADAAGTPGRSGTPARSGMPGRSGTPGGPGTPRTHEADRTATGATAQTPVADLTPQPAVGDIETLVEQVRDSGVRVSLVRMGRARALPPGTGLTMYRICQESLTNILKHAGPAPTATVMLQWTAASLVLEVTDDGRGAAAGTDGAGQGVLGMRERAAMLGGTLTVGPRPGGGYRVRAEIPLPRIEEPR